VSAGRICSRVMATAWPNETVRVAAQRMAGNDVGTLVVVEPNGASRAVGIVTDRGIAVRCVAAGIDPATAPVSRIMTAQVQSVGEEAPIEGAVSRMATSGTRRLVVTDHRHAPVGILSLDDVLDLFTEEAASIRRLLEKQKPVYEVHADLRLAHPALAGGGGEGGDSHPDPRPRPDRHLGGRRVRSIQEFDAGSVREGAPALSWAAGSCTCVRLPPPRFAR